MSDLVHRLAEALRRVGCEFDLGESRHAGDAARLAAETPDETKAVVVVGGDGTLREVLEGLNGRRIPIVVLPTGTENILAKHFGFHARVDAVVRAVTHGRLVDYDLGVCNQQTFFLLVGVGFDAEVVRRLSEERAGHISYWSYVRPAAATLLRYRFPAVRVDVDGRTVYDGRALVWIGILSRYSMGTHILSRALPDDGLLDVCILPCRSRYRLFTHAGRLLLGRHLRPKDVQYHQCRTATVTSVECADVQIDGDYAGVLPVECRVIEAGARFLVPPDEHF